MQITSQIYELFYQHPWKLNEKVENAAVSGSCAHLMTVKFDLKLGLLLFVFLWIRDLMEVFWYDSISEF